MRKYCRSLGCVLAFHYTDCGVCIHGFVIFLRSVCVCFTASKPSNRSAVTHICMIDSRFGVCVHAVGMCLTRYGTMKRRAVCLPNRTSGCSPSWCVGSALRRHIHGTISLCWCEILSQIRLKDRKGTAKVCANKKIVSCSCRCFDFPLLGFYSRSRDRCNHWCRSAVSHTPSRIFWARKLRTAEVTMPRVSTD